MDFNQKYGERGTVKTVFTDRKVDTALRESTGRCFRNRAMEAKSTFDDLLILERKHFPSGESAETLDYGPTAFARLYNDIHTKSSFGEQIEKNNRKNIRLIDQTIGDLINCS